MCHALDRPLSCVGVLHQAIDPADFAVGDAAIVSGAAVARRLARNATGEDGNDASGGTGSGSGSGSGSGAGAGTAGGSGAGGQALDIPTKLQHFAESVHVACRVGYLDMEGRVDGVALKSLLETVKPRKMVLVHGPEACKAELVQYCKKIKCEQVRRVVSRARGAHTRASHTNVRRHTTPQVFTPQKGECLDMSSNTSIFRATLRDNLYQELKFREVGAWSRSTRTRVQG